MTKTTLLNGHTHRDRPQLILQDQIRSGAIRRGEIRSVLFDFDGTLSLIRQGWQEVMVPMMVEILEALDTGEIAGNADRDRHRVCRPPDRQADHLPDDRVVRPDRRREAASPLSRSNTSASTWTGCGRGSSTASRDSKQGRSTPLDMVVPGALDVLDNVRARGLTCYLASGTDQPYVLDEAEALGLTPYFADSDGVRIYGALDEYKRFSKAQVIQDILRSHDATAAANCWPLATALSRSRRPSE